MNTMEWFFWLLFALVFYTYLGYGLLLFVLVRLKRLFGRGGKPPQQVQDLAAQVAGNANKATDEGLAAPLAGNADKATGEDQSRLTSGMELPHITMLIAAYNEEDYVAQKVQNTRELQYPADKLHQLWVTDGSTDRTPVLLSQYGDIEVLHQPQRGGKIAAMNRAMAFVTTPLVVFSDANTMLGRESLRRIARMFENPRTGCVSGEKRIFTDKEGAASAAGEGIYWKYESKLKSWDAELHSVVGAAGELFAIRTELYQEVEPDTLLDDFIISLRVAMQGYKIDYDPEAYAIEHASANVREELKRKVRIAAGGIQAVVRLHPLLNVFKYGLLSFQYISHRVLRWTITPFALLSLLPLNIALAQASVFYTVLLFLQGLFYATALTGWLFERRKIKIKLFFVPFYFFVMNYAVFAGLWRYLGKKQSVNWERARRAH
ncbi:MAG: glycosyltransferase family 2 protein [Bacteroidales bacterium]|nr:glycosyltransferase family 2 protein [Bacteroidales bacterium]